MKFKQSVFVHPVYTSTATASKKTDLFRLCVDRSLFPLQLNATKSACR